MSSMDEFKKNLSVQKKEIVKVSQFKKSKTEADVRNTLAMTFVYCYFGILALIIFGVPIYNFLMLSIADEPLAVISVKDAILTYNAVVGSAFGLVVAYYFQSRLNKSK